MARLRLEAGTGKRQGSTGQVELDAVLDAFLRRAALDAFEVGQTTATKLGKELGQVLSQRMPRIGSSTAAEDEAHVSVALERQSPGALRGGLPPGTKAFLASFAKAAGAVLHVQPLAPAPPGAIQLAAAKALGDIFHQTPGDTSPELPTAPPPGLLRAMREIQKGVETRELPEVVAAKRRHDETHGKA